MATSTRVLDIIASAELCPTEHLLLRHFVETAVDSESAARYLHARIGAGEDQETSLRSFKTNWRRLVFLRKSLIQVGAFTLAYDVQSQQWIMFQGSWSRRDGSSCTIIGADRSDARSVTIEPRLCHPSLAGQSL